MNIWRQGFHALRLGIALFVVPFIFCYHPELLMIGAPADIVVQTGLAVAAMACVTAGFIGYLRGRLGPLPRLAMVGAGVGFIVQGLLGLTLAPALVAAVALAQHYGGRRAPQHSS